MFITCDVSHSLTGPKRSLAASLLSPPLHQSSAADLKVKSVSASNCEGRSWISGENVQVGPPCECACVCVGGVCVCV